MPNNVTEKIITVGQAKILHDDIAENYIAKDKIGDGLSIDNETGILSADTVTNLGTLASKDTVEKSDLSIDVQASLDKADTALQSSSKGAANGVAELNDSGKIPSSQLPSYVDDVLEYTTLSTFPITGETGKIYTALDTNKIYRWSGSGYVEISESLALGETSATAYRGDRGKTAYDHSQIVSGNPHNVTASDVGLGNVNNTSDADKPISTATQTALTNKANTSDLTAHTSNTDNPHSVTATQLGVEPDGTTITANSNGTISANYSNPNLLDNWYFADPINQRGESNLTLSFNGIDGSYMIDRWFSATFNVTGTTNLSISEDGLNISSDFSGSGLVWFGQLFKKENLLGKTLTFSALITENNCTEETRLQVNTSDNILGLYDRIMGISISPGQTGLVTTTGEIPQDISSPYLAFILCSNYSANLTVKAMKLELGSRQTLAHQDADENWVLNDPPPNKALELAKCRYYYRKSTSDISAELAFSHEMRLDNPSKSAITGGFAYSAEFY